MKEQLTLHSETRVYFYFCLIQIVTLNKFLPLLAWTLIFKMKATEV